MDGTNGDDAGPDVLVAVFSDDVWTGQTVDDAK